MFGLEENEEKEILKCQNICILLLSHNYLKNSVKNLKFKNNYVKKEMMIETGKIIFTLKI